MKRYLVMMLDPHGIPRAYGAADELPAAKDEARRQLTYYRKLKADEGFSHLAGAEYTEKVHVFGPGVK